MQTRADGPACTMVVQALQRLKMFILAASAFGFKTSALALADETMLRRTLSGDTGAVWDMVLTPLQVDIPQVKRKGQTVDDTTRATTLKVLQTLGAEFTARSHAEKVGVPLFCAAAAAALMGDRTLADAFPASLAQGVQALKDAAASKKRAKAETPSGDVKAPAAPSVGKGAPVADAAPVADPINDALRLISEASDAGLLTHEHWLALSAIMTNEPTTT